MVTGGKMTKQQLMRRRFYGTVYVLTALLTGVLLAAAILGKGGAAYHLYGVETTDLLTFFPPLFVGEYLLWRTGVYLFCTPGRSARRTVYTVLYGLLGLGMLVFSFHSDIKWWLVGAYAALRGIDALADLVRDYVRFGEGKHGISSFFFILIALSAAAFVMVFGASLWGFLFPKGRFAGFLFVFLVQWAPPRLLAVVLLRKCVLGLSGGTGGKAFLFLYGGIAVGILMIGDRFFIGPSLPWLLVCAYGVVQAVDTLLSDVRAPRRREV